MRITLKLLITAVVASLGFTAWRWVRSMPSVPRLSTAQSGRDLSMIKSEATDQHRRGDIEGFIRVLDRVPDDSPEKARALFEQALAYRQIGDGIEFERTIAGCLARESNQQAPSETTLGAWGLLVDHYLIQQRWEDARDVLWKIFQAAPDLEGKKYILLRLLAPDDDRYDTAQAIEWHGRFVARNSHDADARRALGLHLAHAGRMEEARTHLEFCAQNHPETPRFVESWLWFLLFAEDLDAATQTVEALPAAFDQLAPFWLYRGELHELRGEWSPALDCYHKALAIAPHRLDANNRLAQALRASRRRSEVLEQAGVTKQLSEAKRSLLDLRDRLLRESIVADSQTCATLAELCRVLGLNREALAWSSFE
jgi:tetratricopeptide (TPR) repeat protein